MNHKTVFSLLAAGFLALTGYSQVLNTNTNPPVLSGPFIDFLGSLSTATNWGIASGGIYAPDSKAHKHGSAGAFAVILYNISPYVATGVGLDWIDNDVTMPNAQVQFQAPLRVGGTNGVIFRPFAFTGIATGISGGSEQGQVEGLFGAGLGVKIWKGLNIFYAIEQRTGQDGPWHLGGVAYSVDF